MKYFCISCDCYASGWVIVTVTENAHLWRLLRLLTWPRAAWLLLLFVLFLLLCHLGFPHTQWGRSESEMSAHARRGPQLTLSLQTKASLATLLQLRLRLWLWLLHVILIKGPQEPHTLFTCDDAGCGSGKWVAAAAAASVVANWLQRSQLAECLITWALIMYVAVSAGFSHTSQIALLIFIKVNRKGANILYIVPDRHT